MNKSILIAGTIFLLLLVVGIIIIKRDEISLPNSNGNIPSSVSTSPGTQKTYSMSDIATHKNSGSCWSAINGKVYDLTAWISQHPGGPDMILSICGTDGSAAFNNQHGGQRRPNNELSAFYIGDLSSN